MATVKAVIRKDKPLKDGTWPVAIRIIAQSKPKYINVGASVNALQWNALRGELTGKHPRFREVNAILHRMVSEIQSRIDDFKLRRVEPELDDLIVAKSKNEVVVHDFFTIAEEKRATFLAKRQQGTYLKWKFVLRKFSVFCNGSLRLDAMTPELVNSYVEYLRNVLKNNPNTVHANVAILRAVWREVQRRGLGEGNPFEGLDVRQAIPFRDKLSLEEMERIVHTELDRDSNTYLAQQTFIFATLCWGMRFRDVCLLKPSHFNGRTLSYLTSKSGFKKRITLVMSERAYLIYRYYLKSMLPEQPYLFPLLKKEYSDVLDFEKAVSSANAKVNVSLKRLALKAKIDKTISFHIARHSFVDIMKHNGISSEMRMQMVGHSSESAHKRYHGEFDTDGMSSVVNGIIML